jgi:hypothetical protein
VSRFREKATAPLKPSRARDSCRGWLLANDSQRGVATFERADPRTATRSTPALRRRRCLARILARGLNAPSNAPAHETAADQQSAGSGSVAVAAIGRTDRRPSSAVLACPCGSCPKTAFASRLWRPTGARRAFRSRCSSSDAGTRCSTGDGAVIGMLEKDFSQPLLCGHWHVRGALWDRGA